MIKFKEYVFVNEKLGVVENVDVEAEKIYDFIKKTLMDVKYDSLYFYLMDKFQKGEEAKGGISMENDSYKIFLSGQEFEGLRLDIVFIQSFAIQNIRENGKFLELGTVSGDLTKFKKDKRSRYFMDENKQKSIKIEIMIGMNLETFMNNDFMGIIQYPTKVEEYIKNIILNSVDTNKAKNISDIAHELSHNLVSRKISKKGTRMRSHLGYDAFISSSRQSPIRTLFEIFHNMYFTHGDEIHVYPSEIYVEAKNKGITKKTFFDFLKNNRVYKNLVEIKNNTYEKFLLKMVQEMENIDNIMLSIGMNPEDMTRMDKIKTIIKTAHGIFLGGMEKKAAFLQMALQMKKPFEKSIDFNDFLETLDFEMRPYKKHPETFFKKKIASMSRTAYNTIKRISKIYDLLP